MVIYRRECLNAQHIEVDGVQLWNSILGANPVRYEQKNVATICLRSHKIEKEKIAKNVD